VSAEAPGRKGEIVAGDGEKRQQGDAVGAAEAVDEVGDGDVELMLGRRQDEGLGLGGLLSSGTKGQLILTSLERTTACSLNTATRASWNSFRARAYHSLSSLEATAVWKEQVYC